MLDESLLELQESATILGLMLSPFGAKPLNYHFQYVLQKIRSRLADGLPPRCAMIAFQTIH